MKFLLISALLSFPFVSLWAEEPFPPSGAITGHVMKGVENFAARYAANDYHCGAVNVSLAEGWRIEGVSILEGSIQNQFQFNKSDIAATVFKPNKYTRNSIQVRQLTGFFIWSNVFWTEDPINMILSIRHVKSNLEFSFNITKEICTFYDQGEVSVKQLTGDQTLSYKIQDSERDDLLDIRYSVSSAFYTPAYVLIPDPDIRVKLPGNN